MAYEYSEPHRVVHFAPIELDTVPIPGEGVDAFADDDTGALTFIAPSGAVTTMATTGATYPASAASVTITQTEGTAAGATMTISAQSAGGGDKDGGSLVLMSGAGDGKGDPGTIVLKVGATQIMKADGTGLAFGAGEPVATPAVTGAKADAVAASILTALVSLGLVTDSTT